MRVDQFDHRTFGFTALCIAKEMGDLIASETEM